jgi:hypothetical protein
MVGASGRPPYQRFHSHRFHGMKEFRKVLVRQIVNRQNSLGFRERRLNVLAVKNVWSGLS